MTMFIGTKIITTTGMTERLLFWSHMRTRTSTCPSPMITHTSRNCITGMSTRTLNAQRPRFAMRGFCRLTVAPLERSLSPFLLWLSITHW